MRVARGTAATSRVHLARNENGPAEAGRDTVAAAERLALLLGLSVALIPILIVSAIHLPIRWRFVREATAGAKFIDASEDLDLFAVRALANQPMHVLGRVSDDPAGAWRRGVTARPSAVSGSTKMTTLIRQSVTSMV